MHNCNCIIYIGPDDIIDKAHTEYNINSKGYKSYTLIRGCNKSVIIDEIEEFADHIFCNTKIRFIDTKDKITYIGSVAFGMNNNLEKIILGKNVRTIVSDSISSSKLKEVYIRATEPPENENTFSSHAANFKIYVEPGCGEVYKNHPDWSNLRNFIQEAESEF